MKIIDKCKNAKAVFDTFTIVKKVVILVTTIGSLGGGAGYLFTDSEPVPVPVTVGAMIQPEYAPKDHTHALPPVVVIDHTLEIEAAIAAYDLKHKKAKH